MTRLIIAVVVVLVSVACGGLPTSPDQPTSPDHGVLTACPIPTTKGSMRANIDGVPWSAVCVGAAAMPGSPITSIVGTDDPNGFAPIFNSVGVVFLAGRTGTFSISNAALTLQSVSLPFGPDPGGTVTITTYTSTNIVGTFSFTLGGKTVRDGVFNITFQP